MRGAFKSTGGFELAFFSLCQNHTKYTVSGMCYVDEISFLEIAHGEINFDTFLYCRDGTLIWGIFFIFFGVSSHLLSFGVYPW